MTKLNSKKFFAEHLPDYVINLAAQAGVRHSLNEPRDYIDANISGFLNILESCRNFGTKHLVYASTSSVYGGNTKMPFSENDGTNHPNKNVAWDSNLPNPATSGLAAYRVYNISNNAPIDLMDCVAILEKRLNKKSIRNYMPMQPGDVESSWASANDLVNNLDYEPATSIEEGINAFVDWYLDYSKINV
jgi:nucleoside-diphosphate-sugar epimerase